MFVHSLILLLLLLLLPAANAQQALSFPANVLTKSLYTPAEMSLLLSNHTQLLSQDAIDTSAPNCMTGSWSPTAIDLWHAGRHLVKTRGDFWVRAPSPPIPNLLTGTVLSSEYHGAVLKYDAVG
jgi:hypothetical protein